MEVLLHGIKKTSPGAGGIPFWVFQKCSFELSEVVSYLLNLSFNLGKVRDQYGTLLILPHT